MGYLTDTGFCGAYDSVIGMESQPAMDRMRTLYPARLEVADSRLVQVNASRFTLNPDTGECLSVKRVNLVVDLVRDTMGTPLKPPRCSG
jgi:calcineurin-like phosphoesterase